MKQKFGMKNKLLAHAFAAMLLGAASFVPTLVPTVGANSDDATFGKAGDVSYVSGGVGTDSIDKLNSLSGDFNLKLVFAMNSGNYVSDVRVAIANAAGKTVLDTMSAGPWFLTKLPAGNYQVEATFAGNAVKRQVAVGAVKLNTVDFRWAAE